MYKFREISRHFECHQTIYGFVIYILVVDGHSNPNW